MRFQVDITSAHHYQTPTTVTTSTTALTSHYLSHKQRPLPGLPIAVRCRWQDLDVRVSRVASRSLQGRTPRRQQPPAVFTVETHLFPGTSKGTYAFSILSGGSGREHSTYSPSICAPPRPSRLQSLFSLIASKGTPSHLYHKSNQSRQASPKFYTYSLRISWGLPVVEIEIGRPLVTLLKATTAVDATTAAEKVGLYLLPSEGTISASLMRLPNNRHRRPSSARRWWAGPLCNSTIVGNS